MSLLCCDGDLTHRAVGSVDFFRRDALEKKTGIVSGKLGNVIVVSIIFFRRDALRQHVKNLRSF